MEKPLKTPTITSIKNDGLTVTLEIKWPEGSKRNWFLWRNGQELGVRLDNPTILTDNVPVYGASYTYHLAKREFNSNRITINIPNPISKMPTPPVIKTP